MKDMPGEKSFMPKPERPTVLYHASRNVGIEAFEPRALKVRDRNEGPRVFATPSRAVASMFLIESDDSWVKSGVEDGVPYMVISDESRYRALDTGGVVYSLPAITFENDPDKGLGEFEWTSAEPVVPNEKESVPSALVDMLAHGVQVYFVNTETFHAIEQSDDYGWSIRHNLTPYKA